ncbi:MAG: hypothetical protein P1U87_20225 [Verrucomicrobiales bacterium]|nr:hypothetical protein [Verrucomicrobiales bacterium]
MVNASPLLVAQMIATCAMFGVIWLVQLVTYPQFAGIDSVDFPAYHSDYSRRITWIVGPLMILELAASAGCVWILWNSPLRWLAVAGLLLVLLIWATTALLQVPQHEKLSNGKDPEVIAALVAGNWIRVALWAARIPVVSLLLFRSPGS